MSYVGGSAVPSFPVFRILPPDASKTTAENEKTAGWQGPNLLCWSPLFFE